MCVCLGVSPGVFLGGSGWTGCFGHLGMCWGGSLAERGVFEGRLSLLGGVFWGSLDLGGGGVCGGPCLRAEVFWGCW